MRRLSYVLAAVVTAGALWAPAAHAQTADGGMTADHCTSSAAGDSGLGGGGQVGGGAGGGGGGSWGGGGGAPATTTTTALVNDGEDGVCGSLLDQIAPGDNPGPQPTSHYDIGYDEGGNCICSARRITGLVTGWLFTWAGWVVRIGLGIVDWVLKFAVVHVLMPSAQRISDAYQHQIVDRSGLAPLFLFLCALWAGFMAFTGRIGRGAAELGTSLLILAIAGVFWSNPGRSLTNGLDFVAGVSSEMAAVGTGADPNASSTDTIGHNMQAAIHKAFIENPHQLIDWGRPIPQGDKCRAVYDQAVATGPWGTSSKPRKAMKAAGCTTEDAFNRTPSLDRLFASLLVLVASLLLITMIVLVAYELLKAQLEVLVALIIWPFAILFAALPGKGRAFFWHFVGSTAMALVKVLAMMLVLALTLTATAAVLSATTSEKLVPQMLLVIAVVGMGIYKRKGIMEGSKRAVREFTNSLSGGKASHSGKGWLSPAAAGFTGGALANRAQHAIQQHGNNKRSREMVDLTRQRNGIEGARDDAAMAFGSQQPHIDNLLFIFNGGNQQQASTRQPYQPRYQPPRRRPPLGIEGGSGIPQPRRPEPGGLNPGPTVIPLDSGAVREAPPAPVGAGTG